jgi:hypothetical protein
MAESIMALNNYRFENVIGSPDDDRFPDKPRMAIPGSHFMH